MAPREPQRYKIDVRTMSFSGSGRWVASQYPGDDECFKCLTKRGTILPNKKPGAPHSAVSSIELNDEQGGGPHVQNDPGFHGYYVWQMNWEMDDECYGILYLEYTTWYPEYGVRCLEYQVFII